MDRRRDGAGAWGAHSADDWPEIWPFLRQIVTAGETYAWRAGLHCVAAARGDAR